MSAPECDRHRFGRALVVVASPAAFARCGAAAIGAALRRAAEGDLSVALSGGSTPEPVYRALVKEEVPWDRVRLYFADERAVPPEDPASNYRLVRGSLLDRLTTPPAAVHRMEGERSDLDDAATAYDRLLPDRLDLIVLGIGQDGHTASLFPDSPLLAEAASGTTTRVAVACGPSAPKQRLTVMPSVIRDARQIVVLASGRAKAAAVSWALGGAVDASSCPARLAEEGTWILDRKAASRLPLRG